MPHSDKFGTENLGSLLQLSEGSGSQPKLVYGSTRSAVDDSQSEIAWIISLEIEWK